MHTPGPWRYDCDRVAIVADVPPEWWVPDGDEPPVTQIVYLRGAMGGHDTEADRALMVAAPDLLDAARMALECFLDGENPHRPVVGQLRAAIAKAERS